MGLMLKTVEELWFSPTNTANATDKTLIAANTEWLNRDSGELSKQIPYSVGRTLDCMLSATRAGKAAARCFRQGRKGQHTRTPRVITVDQPAAYPVAVDALKADETSNDATELRPSKS